MNLNWKIKNLEIKNQVIIAPMAGVTNSAYRIILKEFGAGLIYTEMISDKGLLYENKRTIDMIKINKSEHPIALQLFGNDVESMTRAAMYIDKNTKADIIDINMGCPVQKVVKSGAGSKLMTTPELAYEIVSNIVKNVNKPITVKIRSGWDHKNINAVEFSKLMEKAGVSAITIHGRTKSDMYSGKVNLDIIKKVKENVSIPVIGNGDITSPEEAKHMLEYTKCDAIMVGRGLLGNPFLIGQIIDFLETGKYRENITLDERKDIIFKHLNKLIILKGEHIATLEMRNHGAWYLKGLPNSSNIKTQICSANNQNEFKDIIEKYFKFIKKK